MDTNQRENAHCMCMFKYRCLSDSVIKKGQQQQQQQQQQQLFTIDPYKLFQFYFECKNMACFILYHAFQVHFCLTHLFY